MLVTVVCCLHVMNCCFGVLCWVDGGCLVACLSGLFPVWCVVACVMTYFHLLIFCCFSCVSFDAICVRLVWFDLFSLFWAMRLVLCM